MKKLTLMTACAFLAIYANTAHALSPQAMKQLCVDISKKTGQQATAVIVVSAGKDIVYSCKTFKESAPVENISLITTYDGCVTWVDAKGYSHTTCT